MGAALGRRALRHSRHVPYDLPVTNAVCFQQVPPSSLSLKRASMIRHRARYPISIRGTMRHLEKTTFVGHAMLEDVCGEACKVI